MFLGLLSPLNKLSIVAAEVKEVLTSIEVLTVGINTAASNTASEVKKQTGILTEIKDLIKSQAKGSDAGVDKLAAKGGLKPLSLKETGMAAFMVVGMTAAVVAAAGILSFIQVISPIKLLTVLAVTAVIALISPIFVKIANTLKSMKSEKSASFKGMSISGSDNSGLFALAGATLLTMVGMTAAIAISSWVMQLIIPVSPAKLITALLITAVIALMSTVFVKIANTLKSMKSQKSASFKGMSFSGSDNSGLFALAGATLLTMVGMTAAITLSSWVMQLIIPVSPAKLITALLIAATIALMSTVFVKITNALKSMKPKKGMSLPGSGTSGLFALVGGTLLTMVGMMAAIAMSSLVLQLVVPVEYKKLETVFLIGLAMIPVSFAFSMILKSMRGVSIKKIMLAALALPAMALGIAGVAWIFNNMLPDEYKSPPVEWSLTAGLSLLAFAFSFSMVLKAVKRANIAQIAFTTLAIIAMSVAIVGVAWVFNNMLPDAYNSPPVEWSLKSGLAILAFAIPFTLVTIVFKKAGIGLKDIGIGLVGTVAVAVGILAVAWIFTLLEGVSFVAPPMDWALGAAIAITLFTLPVLVIGLIATSGVGAVGILLGVVGMIVIAAGMLAVAWILNYMPDLGAIGANITAGLLAPINGMVDVLKRFKEEIGIENLLPLAGGIVAISGSLLVLAGATAGVAAAGLAAGLAGVGTAFLAWVSGEEKAGPMEVLLKLADNSKKIMSLATPLKEVASSFVTFSKYASVSQVEAINALIKSTIMPITPEDATSLGISNMSAYMKVYASSTTKVAKAYGQIAKHSNGMNVEAIKASTEMFQALAFLASAGKDDALSKLGDKLIAAVKELASMIADFEGTVKNANTETNKSNNSLVENIKETASKLIGGGKETTNKVENQQTSKSNFDSDEIVDAIENLKNQLVIYGVKINE